MGKNVHYNKEKVIPKIIRILGIEGYKITEDNIKIWGSDVMRMQDVVNGCNHVKYDLESNIVVYTNKVPNLKYLETNEKVKIIDEDVLKELCLKHKDLELYDLIS